MSDGWDVVRVRDHAEGGSYTTTRHLAAKRGDTVLEGIPAVDKHGAWLPPTPRKNLEPVRDERGRFTHDEPATGEEEA